MGVHQQQPPSSAHESIRAATSAPATRVPRKVGWGQVRSVPTTRNPTRPTFLSLPGQGCITASLWDSCSPAGSPAPVPCSSRGPSQPSGFIGTMVGRHFGRSDLNPAWHRMPKCDIGAEK